MVRYYHEYTRKVSYFCLIVTKKAECNHKFERKFQIGNFTKIRPVGVLRKHRLIECHNEANRRLCQKPKIHYGRHNMIRFECPPQ